MLHHRQRGFTDHPSRLAIGISVDLAAFGIWGMAIDSGQRQCRGIRHADVMARPEKQHRVIRRDGIEILPRRMSLIGQSCLIVTAPDDPASRCASFRGLIYHRNDLRNSRQPAAC